MTRYARSAIPGRPQQAPRAQPAGLDRMVFGAPGAAGAPRAADGEFPSPVDPAEGDVFLDRAHTDRRRPGAERRSAPRRGGDFVPLREPAGYPAAPDGRRGLMLLAFAVMILAAFGFVVWNAYRDEGEGPVPDAPVLGASGPFKREVIAPGEAAGSRIAEEAEVLGAPPEPARSVSDAASEERPPASPPPLAADPPELRPPPLPPAAAAAGGPVALIPARTAAEPQTARPSAPTPSAPSPSVPSASLSSPSRSPGPAPVAAAAAPAAPASAPPAVSGSGDWLVQIAATSTEASALDEWNRHAAAHPDLFAGTARVIQPADVNGRRVFRLRVGAFASKAEAAAFCSAFKAKGGNCYPAVK